MLEIDPRPYDPSEDYADAYEYKERVNPYSV